MAKANQEVVKVSRDQLAQTGKRIDDIRREHERAYAEADNDFARTFVLSCSLIDLRLAVRQYLPVLRELQGSRLGFLTDRDPGKDTRNAGPYPDQVVVDCAVEAVVRGARWVGNEFNILAGGCYLTKEFWARKVRELEPLTDLEIIPGVPEMVGTPAKCVVGFEAKWNWHGRPMSLARRFPIVLRQYQTDDATLGKAEGRMLRAIHKRMTGAEISDAGDDDPPAVEAAAAAALEGGDLPALPGGPPAGPPAAAEDRPATEEEMREWERAEDETRGPGR